MCGPCGPMGDDPVQRVYVQPEPPPVKRKETVLDPRYLNIVVPENVNWNQKADLAGLKAVELGQEHLSMEPNPTQYFKVITQDNILWYKKEPALKVAQQILQGAEIPNEANKQITELCGAIISVSDNVSKYNSKNKSKAENYISSEASGAQVEREGFEKLIGTYKAQGKERFKVPVSSTQMEDIDSKLDVIQSIVEGLPKLNNPKKRIIALAAYRERLEDYLNYLKNFLHATFIEKHPELNNINNVINSVNKEIRALKETNIAARLAQIEFIDKQIPQLITHAEQSFAKEGLTGTPGVTLYEADQLLKQRRKLVQDLSEWVSTPQEYAKEQELRAKEEESKKKEDPLQKTAPWEASLSKGGHTFLMMQEAPIAKKLAQAEAKLPGSFSEEQMKILGELKNGQVRKQKSHLGGLVKTKREDADVANEIRPILTTVMARAMLLNDAYSRKDAEAIEKHASKFGDIWLEISRPNNTFNQKLQSFFEGWSRSKTG